MFIMLMKHQHFRSSDISPVLAIMEVIPTGVPMLVRTFENLKKS